MVNAKGVLEQDFCALLWAFAYLQAVWERIPGGFFICSRGHIHYEGSDDQTAP